MYIKIPLILHWLKVIETQQFVIKARSAATLLIWKKRLRRSKSHIRKLHSILFMKLDRVATAYIGI